MAKILLVEDDKRAADSLREWLELQKHTVETCNNGTDGLFLMKNCGFDLVILDWELPDISGIEILQQLGSARRDFRILMLTGRSDVREKELGLDEGADDYLTKPFEMRELGARIRALLRRDAGQHSSTLKCRDLQLDLSTGRVYRGEEEIKLLATEFALLEFFMRNPGRLFKAEDLLERVWGSDSESTITAVRTYMTRLRKKIERSGAERPYITTLYAQGYRMDC